MVHENSSEVRVCLSLEKENFLVLFARISMRMKM